MFGIFKKKEAEKPWIVEEYNMIMKKKRHVSDFVQSANYRGFRRMQISVKYDECVKNAVRLTKEKPIIPATAKYSGERIDLTGSKLSIYLSKQREGHPVIMLYIDDAFIGVNIPGGDSPLLKAIQSHATKRAHVEIRFGNDSHRQLVFDIGLMIDGVKE